MPRKSRKLLCSLQLDQGLRSSQKWCGIALLVGWRMLRSLDISHFASPYHGSLAQPKLTRLRTPAPGTRADPSSLTIQEAVAAIAAFLSFRVSCWHDSLFVPEDNSGQPNLSRLRTPAPGAGLYLSSVSKQDAVAAIAASLAFRFSCWHDSPFVPEDNSGQPNLSRLRTPAPGAGLDLSSVSIQEAVAAIAASLAFRFSCWHDSLFVPEDNSGQPNLSRLRIPAPGACLDLSSVSSQETVAAIAASLAFRFSCWHDSLFVPEDNSGQPNLSRLRTPAPGACLDLSSVSIQEAVAAIRFSGFSFFVAGP